MVTMPEELLHLLTEWHTVPAATVGPDGTPNVAPKSVMVMDPETIVWGELYFMQTYENLRHNPCDLAPGTMNSIFKQAKIKER